MEGEFFVLQVVFSHIDVVAVAGDIVERLVFDPDLLFGEPAADVACACQLLPDLRQVFFGKGDIERSLDGLQIVDILQGFFAQFGERFEGPLLFVVFREVPLGVLLRRLCRVKGDGDHLICIVVEGVQFSGAFFHIVAVGVDQFPVDPEFLPVFRVFQLPQLKIVFLAVPLQRRLDDVPEIRGFLADACQ